MLTRKMLREMRANPGQFISVLLLSAMACLVFAGFMANVIGFTNARKIFHEETSLADAWLYGEGFTEDNAKAVSDLSFVEAVQLRTELRGSAPGQDNAQVDLYLERENTLVRPKVMTGSEFDPSDTEGIWLSNNFAKEWEIQVGDDFTINIDGTEFTRQVRGLIITPEYEYMKAEEDSDTNFRTICYVYLSVDAFPVREYLSHVIETADFSEEEIQEFFDDDNSSDSNAAEAVKSVLKTLGADKSNMNRQVLQLCAKLLDEQTLRSFIPWTTLLLTTNDDADVMTHQDEIGKAIDNNYAVMIDETSIIGIQRVSSEVSQHRTFSWTFAFIFVIIALLLISTAMSRMVEQQRTQIGTMNALGMKPATISLHYMSYCFFVSLIGAVLGLLIGFFGVGSYMVDLFGYWYVVPDIRPGFDFTYFLVLAMVVVVCTLTSWFSCRRLLKVPPAAALRPKAPSKARRTLWEKLPFWDRLGFSTQYNLRDISRARLRAVMGIIGTACGMVLVIFSIGCYYMVGDTVDWVFDRIQNFSSELVLSSESPLEKTDRMCADLNGELVMMDAVEIAMEPFAPAAERTKQTLTVLEGKGLYNVTDAKTNVTTLTEGRVGITNRLAKTLGVSPGDTIYWHLYTKNTWHESVIGQITRSPETAGIVMLRQDLEASGEDFSPTLLVTDENTESYSGTEGVTAAYSVEKMKEIFIENYQMIYILIGFMLFFSSVLLIVVLYNSGNLSFHERLKEFATLKVMGLSTAQIRGILRQQNLWLTVIGMIVGSPFATPLLIVMMNSNGDNFDYYFSLPPVSYILSAAFVLTVAVLVSYMFSRKIRRLDMVEILKGIE